jgi:hypothetical protein
MDTLVETGQLWHTASEHPDSDRRGPARFDTFEVSAVWEDGTVLCTLWFSAGSQHTSAPPMTFRLHLSDFANGKYERVH